MAINSSFFFFSPPFCMLLTLIYLLAIDQNIWESWPDDSHKISYMFLWQINWLSRRQYITSQYLI